MSWPMSQDFNEAVQNAASTFADPELKRGKPVVNAIGLPVPRSGNFADVYQFRCADGRAWAVKCFTRRVAGLQERYARVDAHLAKVRLPFTVGFQFLQEGVRIRGQWYPILKMEWVEGFTINEFVSQNLGKPHYLHALVQMWTKLTARLRDARMAHADLQHANVLLVPGATPQKLGLKLIDYDGMWVPALADSPSGEVGHPNFQHPLRLQERLYNADVDRFPHLVIAAALRGTLIGGKPLWDRFNNGDNLLFKETDLRDPANSPVFHALWELDDPVLRMLVGHVALATRQPLSKCPWLDEVLLAEGGPRLTPQQERQVSEILGVVPAVSTHAVSSARVVGEEFNVFRFDDDAPDDEDTDTTFIAKPLLHRRRAAQQSRGPLMIGAGLAVAVLIGVVALSMGRKKETPPQEVAKKDLKTEVPRSPDPIAKKEPVEIKLPNPPRKEPKEKEPHPPENVDPTPAMVVDALVTASQIAMAYADGRLRFWGKDPDSKPAVVKKDPDPKGQPAQPVFKEGLIKVSEGLGDTVSAILFSHDGRRIYASTYEGMVHVLDAMTMQEIARRAVLKGRIYAMTMSRLRNVDRLYTLDEGRHVRIFDPEKWAQLKDVNLESLITEASNTHQITVSPDVATLIVTSDRDRNRGGGGKFGFKGKFGFGRGGEGEFWNLRSNVAAAPPVLQRSPFDRSTRAAAFSADGRVGAAAAPDQLLVWNASTGGVLRAIETGENLRWLGVLPEASAVVGLGSDKLQVWSYSSGKSLMEVEQPHGDSTVYAAVSPRGTRFVTVGTDRAIRVWDARTAAEVVKWEMEQPPRSVTISQDGRFLAVSHANSYTVSIWGLPESAARKP